MSESLKTESATTTQSAETVVKEAATETPAKTETTEAVSMMSEVEGAAAEGEQEKEKEATETTEAAVELKSSDLKLPENSTLDPKVVDEVVSFAKEQKLTQAQAQAILERENNAVASYAQAQENQLKEVSNGVWLEELKNDKELGGEKFKENIHIAGQAFARYSTPEFTALMKKTGLGNHPELNRIFFKIGKEMANDKLVQGGKVPNGTKSIVDRLYGTEGDQKS